LSRNGNGITLARSLADQGVRTVADYRDYLLRTNREPHTLGIVHPASMHNLLLRYWLASHAIDPDRDVRLQTLHPAQMLADLKNGSIDGYCVGEPWNVRADREGHGVQIAGDLEIWAGHPGKVLGAREDWALAYPNTHIALTKALLEACRYCADPQHWDELSQLLSDRRYLGMRPELIRFGIKAGCCDESEAVPYPLLRRGAEPTQPHGTPLGSSPSWPVGMRFPSPATTWRSSSGCVPLGCTARQPASSASTRCPISGGRLSCSMAVLSMPTIRSHTSIRSR
jgi:hypothetical protein